MPSDNNVNKLNKKPHNRCHVFFLRNWWRQCMYVMEGLDYTKCTCSHKNCNSFWQYSSQTKLSIRDSFLSKKTHNPRSLVRHLLNFGLQNRHTAFNCHTTDSLCAWTDQLYWSKNASVFQIYLKLKLMLNNASPFVVLFSDTHSFHCFIEKTYLFVLLYLVVASFSYF
jgi:hypothetical protein